MTSPSGADLTDPGSTSSSLLNRVRAADDDAWRKLADVYGPLVYRWTRRMGVPAADSADVLQEVFQAVAAGIERFRGKRQGASFRAWLRAITRNKVCDYFRRRGGEADAVGGTDFQMMLAQLPESEASSVLEMAPDDRRVVVSRLLDELSCEFQTQTWQAFWRTTIERQSSVEVARELGMTPNAVRQARFRVMQRLRRRINEFDANLG